MKNDNLPGLSPLWLLCLALVLGVFLTVAIPLIVGQMGQHVDSWIAFSRSIVGAAMTVIAAVVAWFALQHQRHQTIEDQARAQAEGKDIATTALVPVLHAVAVIESNLQYAISAPAPLRADADESVTVALDLLKLTETGFPQYELARELNNIERQRFLMIFSTIRILITTSQRPPLRRSRDAILNMRNGAIASLRKHVAAFVAVPRVPVT